MKKNVIKCMGLLAMAAVMASCGGQKKVEDDGNKKVSVKTAVAVLEEVEDYAVFSSSIEAYKQNNIAPALQAVRIDQILVDVGATVRKGQLLAKMDPMQYNNANAQLAIAETNYKRMQNVYEAGGISKQTMDETLTALEVQRTQNQNLRDNIELRSPIDGVVTARNYDPGDLYAQLPILTVMQINMLKVTISISEQYYPRVKKGMDAEITLDMYPDKVYNGTVSLIYPAIDPASRTFTVEISIPNPTGELRPGMFSRTKLQFGTKQGIMVDDVAIQRQLGTNDKYIFVVKDGVAERRLVTTGIQIGSKVNVMEGVNPGDHVVIAGVSRLMQGTEVEVNNN